MKNEDADQLGVLLENHPHRLRWLYRLRAIQAGATIVALVLGIMVTVGIALVCAVIAIMGLISLVRHLM